MTSRRASIVGRSSPSSFCRTSYAMPARRADSAASPRRRAARIPPPCSWWPALPLVRETNFTAWPAAAHRAAVPPALMSQSSGCAPKQMTRTGSAAGEGRAASTRRERRGAAVLMGTSLGRLLGGRGAVGALAGRGRGLAAVRPSELARAVEEAEGLRHVLRHAPAGLVAAPEVVAARAVVRVAGL